MKSMFRPITYRVTRSSEQEFSKLARSMEAALTDAGYMVLYEGQSELTLTGPAHFSPDSVLSSFSQVKVEKRGSKLVVSADYRSDDARSRWRKNAFLGLILVANLSAVLIVALGIPSTHPELLPAIMIPIVILGLIAAFQLRPRPPVHKEEAEAALKAVLDQL